MTKIRRGMTAYFLPIDEKVGWKGFLSEKVAEYNFGLNSKAAKNGIAPKCSNLCTKDLVYKGYPITLYGYTVEMARILGDWLDEKKLWKPWFDPEKYKNKTIEKIHRETLDIEDICYKIGIVPVDFHAYNLGWVGKNMVAIDFSECVYEN